MDIAKYIGLYLLKNNFCYIHGLGNLELRKKPAVHDGQTLQAPQYEVYLSPTGSIDDNLANFIATHEQTSISKAANALRDFSIQARADLQAGKDVPIPALGKFVEEQGVIRFITDPHLQYTPPSIPALRTAKRVDEAPSFKTTDPAEDTYNRGGSVNWGRAAIWIGLLALVAVIVFFAIRFLNSPDPEAGPATAAQVTDSNALTPPDAMMPDTTLMPQDTAAAPATTATPAPAITTGADGRMALRVVLGTYPTRTAAERRTTTLRNNGNTVEMVARDSSSFLVVMPISAAPADTTRMLDSLRRMFNPKGVSIYR